jgi:hypothetical protein
MEALIIIPLVVMVILGIRIVAGSCDKDRVETYIRERGHKLPISVEPPWSGWFGEQDSRIYWVQYRDSMGNRHEAYAKTSMLSGVYLTEDRIVESSFLMNKPRRNSPAFESSFSGASFSYEEKLERKSRVLEEENKWLRQRIRDLENQPK